MLRHKVWRAINTDEIAEPNAFAIEATVAAFTAGEAWLDALREYLEENKSFVKHFLESDLPQIKMVPSQATYLLWLDCYKIRGNMTKLSTFIRENAGLYISDGNQYERNAQHFLRLNIACPREILEDGLQRLKKGVSEYEEWAVLL